VQGVVWWQHQLLLLLLLLLLVSTRPAVEAPCPVQPSPKDLLSRQLLLLVVVVVVVWCDVLIVGLHEPQVIQ
jgi:hypothetical protein